MANLCPSCGFESPPGFKFCGSCGTPLGGAQAPAAAAAPAAPVATPKPAAHPADEREAVERRQITVAFCDLVGSTDMAEALDPEELRDLVRSYQRVAGEVVEHYGGHIAQYLGDGILIYFGYPKVHEDDAVRAVRAALDILKAVERLDESLDLPAGLRLRARIGIHTGLVVAGEVGAGDRTERLALGRTPNVAARLEGVAESGEAVISKVTQRLVRAEFRLESMGKHALKGLSEPLEVFRVLGVSLVEDPFQLLPSDSLGPLVGRDREVEHLSELWTKAKAGEGQVVLLSGEAGVGKSRLTHAFRQRLEEHPHTYLWARGMALNGSTSFSPMREMLERMCGIQPEDQPPARFMKLEARLAQTGLVASEEAVLLASLLELPVPEGYPAVDLPPMRMKQRTMDALLQLLRQLSEGEPLLLVVEDLHWVDPSTRELLEQVVYQGPTHPMLTFFTTRPHAQPGWAERSYVTRLNLGRLGRDEVEAIVIRVTGGKPIPEAVLEQIVAKTDGVPLFVEELTKMIVESGVLHDAGDRYELVGDLADLAIPSSLQDSLNARLNQLSHGKEVAQVAALLDREFPYGLLQAVWARDEASMQAGLRELVDAEFLYQRGAPPYSSYIFKHALIQDAATESLLKSRRQKIHQAIAQVLTSVHAFRLDGEAPDQDFGFDVADLAEAVETTPERIAQHYAWAGEVEAAVDWWIRAGARGLERSANVEVIDHKTRALQLLESVESSPATQARELSAQTMLGAALTGTRGYAAPEVEAAFTKALALAQLTGERSKIFQADLGLWMFHVVRADFPKALERANDMMALALEDGDRSYFVEGAFALGLTHFFMGAPREALRHLEACVAKDGPDRDRSISRQSGQDAGVCALVYMGLSHWMLGDPVAAVARAEEAITLARRIEHPYSLVYAQHFTSWLRLWMRQYREAGAMADQVIKTSEEMGYFWVTLGSIVRGSVCVADGQAEDGLELINTGLDYYRGAGARLSETLQLALRAKAHMALDRHDEALASVREALGAIESTDEAFWHSDLRRVEGLLLAESDPAAAEAAMRAAIDVARAQEAMGHELRAALTLAEFLVDRGRESEAVDVLRPARGAYPADLALPDLEAADRLLGQIQGQIQG